MPRQKIADRTCPYCHQTFHPRQGTEKFCSRECLSAFRHAAKARSCDTCGKIFSMVGRTGDSGRYCSRECYVKRADTGQVYPEVACGTCGKAFRAKKRDAKYCSPDCYAQAKRKFDKVATCEVCNKQFANTKGRPVRFCSRECFAAGIGKSQTVLQSIACSVCGGQFKPRKRSQTYCSAKCGYAAHAKPRGECLNCGKQIPMSQVPQAKYCSHSCFATHVDLGHSPRTTHPIGTKRPNSRGYIEIKVGQDYPGAPKSGWMLEHRYVYQEERRKIDPDFVLQPEHVVHHKHGDRSNNVPDNLELTVRLAGGDDKHVPGQRVEDLLAFLVKHHRHEVAAALDGAS